MNNIKKLIFIIFLLGITMPSCFAISESEQSTLTLKDCIQKALVNSPNIRKAKISYEMAKKNVKIAQSVYFPTISAGVGYDFSNRNGSNIYNTTSNGFNANAGIREMIWNFGKSGADIKMQKFNRIVARYDFDTMVLNTIFDVKVKYYSALGAKTAIDINSSNLQINERNYQRVNAFFEEGLKSKIDLVNAEVNVTDAKVALSSSMSLYKNALSILNNAMFLAYEPQYNIEIPTEFKNVRDVTPKSLTEFSHPIQDFVAAPKEVDNAMFTGSVETTNFSSLYKFDKFPYSFEECLKIADKNRPDLKAYDATIKAMEQYLKSVQRQYFPELSATGTYGFNANSVNGDSGNTGTFGVGVNLSSSVNIMAEKYQIDNAKLQVDNAKTQLDLLKQNVYFEIQQYYIDMMEYEEQIPLLEQKIKQTLENLELADGRYSVGLGDYIQLQDAKVNYNSAQLAFVKAVYNYNVAKAKLEQSIALDQEITLKLEDK